MKILAHCIENICENKITRNNKNKALKNSIDNKYASINIATLLKTSFVDKTFEIL